MLLSLLPLLYEKVVEEESLTSKRISELRDYLEVFNTSPYDIEILLDKFKIYMELPKYAPSNYEEIKEDIIRIFGHSFFYDLLLNERDFLQRNEFLIRHNRI